MCQSSVFLIKKDGREELVMEDVSIIKPQDDQILMVGMLGERKQIPARIKELQLMEHRIILEEIG
ncbi:MAG TPA: CooT family nickel-binding protein [Firmicutes bacterium]|nr:CooT family nickel-binding protein [Bacillota bacterium]